MFQIRGEERHGFPVLATVQQTLAILVQHGQRHLEDDLGALVEEAVEDADGGMERHNGQEQGEEPGEGDHAEQAEPGQLLVETG